MCEVMTNTAQDRKNAMEVEQMTAKLRDILQLIDENFDGMVSREELEQVLDQEDAVRALGGYGVDVICLVEDAEHIFEGVEAVASGIPFEEFADIISQYRVSPHTCLRATFDMRALLRRSMGNLCDRLLHLEQ